MTMEDQLNLTGKTILIIENDYLSVLLIEEYLSYTNVRLIQEIDNESLFDYPEEHIDLIIKGIGYNEIKNGLSLTKIIKLQHPGIPLIGYSASVYQEDVQSFLKVGCDGFISKPIDFDTLKTLLNKYLAN